MVSGCAEEGPRVRYVYRCSEGVILRTPVDRPGLLEAWTPWGEARRWFVYSWIGKDWQTASRPIDEEDVPPDARLAPSSYKDR